MRSPTGDCTNQARRAALALVEASILARPEQQRRYPVTSPYGSKVVIKSQVAEGLSSSEVRIDSEELIESIEKSGKFGPPVAFSIAPDCIESSTSAVRTDELLRASGRNREDGTEYYIEVGPVAANLPAMCPRSGSSNR
jgi:hypothetical protein